MKPNDFILQDRLQKIKQIINHQYGKENFSGGKDSVVLLAIPDNKIPRVYVDTDDVLEKYMRLRYRLKDKNEEVNR